MEMLVIAIVAIVAFAAVLVPLLRRGGSRIADEREFETGEPLAERTAPAAEGDLMGHERSPPTAQAREADQAADAAAPLAAAATRTGTADSDIEREVLRYREALRAGTLCARCGQANPPGSAYCSDCGKRLPLADAQEFA